ncbi:MAG: tRNA preQ1(34) S-adenosylmethionine ribosyltransferase-isomerase QueA [Bacteroidales bacterium]|jgi:S-adenosylmethionine:tRNA ribosyltransferase-isomerase|nr:tRNA preQ1(34) S-adenosylmethionine ribosyltransferase-isomerase QueA [Bacteroidales bacterium]
MKLSRFKYSLPEELIPAYPLETKDGILTPEEGRLMIVHRDTGKIEHKKFKNILDYFDEGDMMVFNNTRIFPSLLSGEKADKTKTEGGPAQISVFMLRELDRETLLWDVLVDPARKIRIGNKLFFGKNEDLVADVIDNTTSRGRIIRFLFDGPYESFREQLSKIGRTPLPRYLLEKRKPEEEARDRIRCQTVFATEEGAVRVPETGLHFSREMLKKMEIKGVESEFITLHCSLDAERSIDVEDLSKHKIDSEKVFISEKSAEHINEVKRNKRKVCAVGTSTLKAMESSVSVDGFVNPYDGWTSKFIFPPYNVRVPNCMLSNFHSSSHQPFIMVCTFGGRDLVMKAYEEAIAKKYRFLTFGDAMLIL